MALIPFELAKVVMVGSSLDADFGVQADEAADFTQPASTIAIETARHNKDKAFIGKKFRKYRLAE